MNKKRAPALKIRAPGPKIWETFLPIVAYEPSKKDAAPACDMAWMMAKGIEAESPALLVQLRDEVLSLVKRLAPYIEWYSFLVHDYASGVPTTLDDKRCFIHLRFKMRKFRRREVIPYVPFMMEKCWLMTREVELSRSIAGVDASVLDVDRAWAELGKQSAWFLSFIECLDKNADGYQLVRHVRQYLHFFANMAQMRVA